MKKSLFGMFAVAVCLAAALFSGCNKDNGGGKEGEASIEGRYLMSAKPFYCDMAAADEKAVAFSMEGLVEMTFGDLITAAENGIAEADVEPTYLTFNADGTIAFEPQVMDEDDEVVDYTADEMSYSVKGNDFILRLDADMVFDELEIAADEAAQIKPLLKSFDKGLLVYSESDNKIIVNLHYTLKGNELTIFADKALVNDTWNCAGDIIDMVLLMLETQDPATAELIESVVGQVDGMLAGFTKTEVGMKLAKQ